MSFFSKLCQALGFGSDIDFEAEVNALNEADNVAIATSEFVPATSAKIASTGSEDMRNAIFEHVVEVFNKALPDFLARSVDPEAERKLLFDSLDQGLKDYIGRLAVDSDRRCEERWNDEQIQLRVEIDKLRQKGEQMEAERTSLKERQLSAERQKRALSNRLKDLEMQVERLEAEREQFDLENKSLLNKLKVMAVQNPETADVLRDTGFTVENVDELQRKLKEIEKENATLREQLEQAAERQTLSDSICADLRKRLAAANKDVEDLQAITEQVAIVQQAIEERDQTITSQREKIGRLKARVEELEKPAPAPIRASVMAEEAPAQSPAKEATPKSRKYARRREEEIIIAPKITDDDLLDVETGFADHNWFGVEEPEPEAPASVSKTNDNDDFGYRAPEPKPKPYDDGMQMSLFD